MRAKFGVLEQTQGLHLQAKFHLNVFIVSASCSHLSGDWFQGLGLEFGLGLIERGIGYRRRTVLISLKCNPRNPTP